ncbi:MAG: DUF1847 domain-containing protein [Dehalococcoidia bacterium]|jgi:uncharacterized metal-binding protein|nr:DUF1847 domain-containing protein [Dehalococcoidia bacterium]
MEGDFSCANCDRFVCHTEHALDGPEGCPTRCGAGALERASQEYRKPDVREFARQASIQEFECYLRLPEGLTPRNPRVEEVAQFAKKMGYRRLGVAFCVGLRNEAKLLDEILVRRGFEVVSVCCQVGGVSKESVGISEEQKIAGPGNWETMCNPVAQAMLLNDAATEFNIAVGLCVGHDSLFFKYSSAPVTVLIAKDRVLGHNPAAGLYLSKSYYRKLRRKEP